MKWSGKKSQVTKGLRVNKISIFETPTKSEKVTAVLMDSIKMTYLNK